MTIAPLDPCIDDNSGDNRCAVSERYVATPLETELSGRGTSRQKGVQRRRFRRVPAQFGPLVGLLQEPEVTDVFVNAFGDVWLDRGGGVERIRTVHLEPSAVRALAVGLVALGGRHVDEATPCADVRLADGIRVHAVLPPVSRVGAVLSIRAPSIGRLSLDDLEHADFFSRVARKEVTRLVRARANLLVTGAGGSGKTTLLAALLAEAPPGDRILTLEDVAELRIDHPQVVSLETRQANLEGAGRIDLARLVREALRMRPDRLVLGECRGEELRELMAALNTGHDGGAGTLHANGIDSVPARLEALGALAGLSPEAVARQAVSAFDAVLHVERRVDGSRRLAGIASFGIDADGRLSVVSGRVP